ncbi:DUF4168 domain-containing protein [Marinobacterium lutimaris]|uniref:DUF4168 domain-containing protein n=1 Tax=Marinobacterium lutimaris TaxID=568106 RepID=A0A1H6CGA4_9GAMM|nr:DUF4168 domain-containing protein [Marinobacterium lutimaris]SEG72014.1 protein of unknown function [Marinobacterium lutimaris]
MSAFKIGTGLALAAALLTAPALQAQESNGQQSTGQEAQQYSAPASQQPQVEVDDATVAKFADAYGEVVALQNDFSTRLQNIEEPTEAQALQEEVQSEMINVVREKGFSVQEYNAIAQRVSQDPELQAQLEALMTNS